jgi:hypothetical protein
VADTTQQGELVGLETHPWAAAVPEAPSGQFVRDVLSGDGKPGRETLDDDNEGFAMGLSASQETKHDFSQYRLEPHRLAPGKARCSAPC